MFANETSLLNRPKDTDINNYDHCVTLNNELNPAKTPKWKIEKIQMRKQSFLFMFQNNEQKTNTSLGNNSILKKAITRSFSS